MIRYIVIVLLALLIGLSGKKVTNKILVEVLVVDLIFIVGSIMFSAYLGFDTYKIMALKESHVVVSGLTVGYALLLGVLIKSGKTWISKYLVRKT